MLILFGIKWIMNQERTLGILTRSLEIEDPFAEQSNHIRKMFETPAMSVRLPVTELQTLSHELKDVRENSDSLKNSFRTQRSRDTAFRSREATGGETLLWKPAERYILKAMRPFQ